MAQTSNEMIGDLPAGFDLDNLDIQDGLERLEKRPAPRERAADGKYIYKPSDKTLERLDRLPKDEIRKELGLDIDEMKKSVKDYGILEAMAWGDFTRRPVRVTLRAGHQKQTRTYATIRLWSRADDVSGEVKWGYELHPVKLHRKVDAEGRPVLKENGEPDMTYDRNVLTKNSVLEINGRQLTPEQVDRLRLTGNLGEPLTTLGIGNKPVSTIYSVDPYNQHELIGVDMDTIIKRLEPVEEFSYSDRDSKTEHKVKLSARMKGELAMGHGQWGKNEAGDNVYIQYNAAAGRLERGISYEMAVRNEVAEQKKAAVAKDVAQQMRQSAAPSQAPQVGQKFGAR